MSVWLLLKTAIKILKDCRKICFWKKNFRPNISKKPLFFDHFGRRTAKPKIFSEFLDRNRFTMVQYLFQIKISISKFFPIMRFFGDIVVFLLKMWVICRKNGWHILKIGNRFFIGIGRAVLEIWPFNLWFWAFFGYFGV